MTAGTPRVTCGAPADLPPGYVERLGRYRHRVFVERLGWSLESRDGCELDRFDRADTVYVTVEDSQSHIAGCARLLPTTQPYLLSEVFPQLLQGALPPHDAHIWELSRFTSMDFSQPVTTPLAQFSSSSTALLLRGVMDCAAHQGAQRLITVSPLGIERLVRRLGVRASQAAAPLAIGGQMMFACWIEVEAA
jgi:N-acyl-L-homoserine lactone synthetase